VNWSVRGKEGDSEDATRFMEERPMSRFFYVNLFAFVCCSALHAQEKKKDLPKEYTNNISMKFTWIAPGTFLMGSPNEETERRADESQHKVTLSKGFYMGVHLVTQHQWAGLMGNYPSNFQVGEDLPVDSVSWDECQKFIKKLRENDKHKRPYRMPTEAEWEYACRAGTTTPFHFGETISSDQANYDGNLVYGKGKKGVRRDKTTSVARFPANAWGLHDMHGNLMQWCEDWHGEYPQDDSVDPHGPKTGEVRVLRGGSWNIDPANCRSAVRGGALPDSDRGIHFIGIRVCFSEE
jgi:formylglycine-generating enzyme